MNSFSYACLCMAFLFATLLALPPLQAQEAMGEKRSDELFAVRKFELLNCSANRAAPVVESALRNFSPEASAECVALDAGSLLVTAPRSSMPLAEGLVRALDSPRIKRDSKNISLDGYSHYHVNFISAKAAAKLIAALKTDSFASAEALVDQNFQTVYWKHDAALDAAVERLMDSADTPQMQMRICFKAYRLDSLRMQALSAALAESMPAGGAISHETVAKALLESIKGLESCAKTEVSVYQGAKVCNTMLDLGKESKIKIAVSYPVVDAKPNEKTSMYADFVFEYPSNIRNSRWTIVSGSERPVGAFLFNGSPSKSGMQFVEIGNLPETLTSKKPLAVFAKEELLLIYGGIAEPEE